MSGCSRWPRRSARRGADRDRAGPALLRRLPLAPAQDAEAGGPNGAERPGYRIVYGVSANTRGGWVSLDGAAALGYSAKDDAEAYAAEVLAEHGEPAPGDPVFKYLGGQFTLPRLDAENL